MKLQGIIPPVITPFRKNGDIDFDLLKREIKIVVKAGSNGVSVSGSTGEGPTIRDDEIIELVKLARTETKHKIPIICGIMRSCTKDAVETANIAKEAGADALMITPTAYNVLVPDELGVYEFYKTISQEVDLPIIIYNVIPQNTITPKMFLKLLDTTKNVIGIKQSVGSVPALYAMRLISTQKGKVFAATDDMLYTCYSLGADGAISAILSLFPEQCVEMWISYKSGNIERAKEIQDILYTPWQSISGQQFPIRLKYALKLMGRDSGYCRSPIVNLSSKDKNNIKSALSTAKLIK